MIVLKAIQRFNLLPSHIKNTDGDKRGSRYLSMKLNRERRDTFGNTELHRAVWEHSGIAKVQQLIDQGADVNAINKKGNSPLHHAVRAIKLDITHYLIKHHANTNTKNNQGITPLSHAFRTRFRNKNEFDQLTAIMDLLQQHGATF